MLDLKAIADAREMGIPEDQLGRITAVMQKLEQDLRAVLVNLPAGPESAIQFNAGEDGR